MPARSRLFYLDDIPTPYRLGVQKRIVEDWPGDFHLAFCAESEPGREWVLDYGDLAPEFLKGKQWRPPRQMNAFSYKWNPGIADALDAWKPDVVILSGYAHPTMWRAARWCIRNKVPFGVSCETSARSSTTTGWRWAVKRAVSGWLVRAMTFGLPVGREAADYLRAFGPTQAPMSYFPNTPDTAPIVAEAKRLAETGGEAPLRAELGITPDLPILLFVGRLVDAKRPLDALTAFRQTRGSHDGVFVIVGDGDQMAALRQAAAGDPRILFTGWLQDPAKVAGLMSIASAMILPSSHEPWGAVVNEAMAAGTPVISSDRVGAATELVRDGENGYLVPVGDIARYARAIGQLLTDPTLAQQLGKAARETAIAQGEEFAAKNLIAGAEGAIMANASGNA